MATKQTSPEISSLAARVMAGYEPTREEIMSMAASLVSQDETPQVEPDYQDRLDQAGAILGRVRDAVSPRRGDAWGEPESQREDPLGR